MGKHRDWTDIEKDYQENGLSYAQLARKYSVPIDTLKKAAARQGWTKRKERKAKKTERKVQVLMETVESAESAVDETAPNGTNENGTIETAQNGTDEMAPVIPLYPDRVMPAETDAERFRRIVDEMMDRVEDAICRVDTSNAGAVKLLTAALKDLRSLKGLDKTELDIQEQKARIEKLRSETAIREVTQEPVVIRFVDLKGAED